MNSRVTPEKSAPAMCKSGSAERRDLDAKSNTIFLSYCSVGFRKNLSACLTLHLGTVQNMLATLYWKKPSPNSLQIRSGYDVYIKKPILRDLMEYYGPDSVSRSGWFGYGWQLILHMLGGDEQLVTMKTLLRGVGVDQLLKEPAILAAMGNSHRPSHLKQFSTAYALVFSLHRSYTGSLLIERTYHEVLLQTKDEQPNGKSG